METVLGQRVHVTGSMNVRGAWSDYVSRESNPLRDLGDVKKIVRGACGREPNYIRIPLSVLKAMAGHPVIKDRIHCTHCDTQLLCGFPARIRGMAVEIIADDDAAPQDGCLVLFRAHPDNAAQHPAPTGFLIAKAIG